GGFTDGGTVDPKPQLDATAQEGQSVKGRSAGALKAFGAIDEPPEAKKPDTVMTGEWLEFEVKVPGQPGRVSRRQIFDVLGPAQRATGKPAIPGMEESTRVDRGMALLGQSELLVAGCQLSASFV